MSELDSIQELEEKIGHRVPTSLAKYDMTWHDYKYLLEKQGFKCANPGCPASFVKGERCWVKTCIDHCHITARQISMRRSVRGLLCHKCNITIGYAEDIAQILYGLGDYTDGYNKGLKRVLPGPDGVKKAPDNGEDQTHWDDYVPKSFVAAGEEDYVKEFQYVQSLAASSKPRVYTDKEKRIRWKGRKNYRPYLDPNSNLYGQNL